MRINTICRTNQPKANGTTPIIFYVNRKKLNTGEVCRAGSWDKSKSAVNTKYAGSDLINRRLVKKKAALHAIIEAQKEFDDDLIKTLFYKYLEKPDDLDGVLTMPKIGSKIGEFFVLIDTLIHEQRNDWSDGYKKRFKTIRSKFLAYDQEFTLQKLTVEWWREFVADCIDRLENSNNTINTDAKVIGRLIEILRDKGYRFESGLDAIAQRYIEPEIMSLEWEDVMKIAEHDLSNPLRPTMPDSRTLWLIGAYTGRRWARLKICHKYRLARTSTSG